MWGYPTSLISWFINFKLQELLDMSQAIGTKSYATLKKEIKLISNRSLIIDGQILINEAQLLINKSEAVRNNTY